MKKTVCISLKIINDIHKWERIDFRCIFRQGVLGPAAFASQSLVEIVGPHRLPG